MLLYLSSRNWRQTTICRSGGMADASDSKSDVGDNVWVRVPPSAPKTTSNLCDWVLFFCLMGRERQVEALASKCEWIEHFPDRRDSNLWLRSESHLRHQKYPATFWLLGIFLSYGTRTAGRGFSLKMRVNRCEGALPIWKTSGNWFLLHLVLRAIHESPLHQKD